jgi:uncharacterized protein DUF3891
VIVQVAPPGQAGGAPRVVIEQLEHTRFAGRCAAAWGNTDFAPLSPKALVEHLVAHHDDGWDIVDASIGRDPTTGLPWNLVQTPLPDVVKAGSRGPDQLEAYHPYCGLLSSMHSYGLYHGRYGLSDKVFMKMIAPEHKPAAEDMLQREIGRQERLKAKLAQDPEFAPLVEEAALFSNYKLLQFFDTLALYFNCTSEAARATSTFPNVPRKIGDDVTITVSRVEQGVYRFSPYPFAVNGLYVPCAFRRLAPQPVGTDMARALATAPVEVETVRFVT